MAKTVVCPRFYAASDANFQSLKRSLEAAAVTNEGMGAVEFEGD